MMRFFCLLYPVAVWAIIGCGQESSLKSDPKAPATETEDSEAQPERSEAEIRRDNALVDAIHSQDIDACRKAIAGGADVNGRYVDFSAFLSPGLSGYTPLMRAAIVGDADITKLLLEHHAETDRERRGRTALYFAAIENQAEIVKLLVAARASQNPKEIKLAHELICAASRGFEMGPGEGYPLYPGAPNGFQNASEISEVLKQGTDINCADPEGHTPLMYAANLGLIDNVKLLLERGADATLQSKYGDTALSLTERPDSSVNKEERRQIVEILKQHLAKDQ